MTARDELDRIRRSIAAVAACQQPMTADVRRRAFVFLRCAIGAVLADYRAGRLTT